MNQSALTCLFKSILFLKLAEKFVQGLKSTFFDTVIGLVCSLVSIKLHLWSSIVHHDDMGVFDDS